MKIKRLITYTTLSSLCLIAAAQQGIYYTGSQLSNPAYHDGQLTPVIGVHNIQVMRANREYPGPENGNGWTYNHQPMMAYWNNTFYMHYLADPVDEHVPPSQTFLMTSKDGYNWTNPEVLFPIYRIPDGYKKPGREDEAKDLDAIMHQRVGYYVSKAGKLYAMGYYGVAYDKKDSPNDGNGIGRVIREIKKDGSLGPIHFIYYNHGFNEKNTNYPFYTKSRDKSLINTCKEILGNPRYMMQWVEESDVNDPIIPLNKKHRAYCDYTLPNGDIVAMWKHALTSVSKDGGKTWSEDIQRAKGFVNSNAKIWGQKLTDGTYATVYNPSEYRWPLAVSSSADGLEYTTLNLVHGEISPMRYGGNYKSFGPQYVRGIQEGNGVPQDGDMWVSYSMNKEDMWVSRIPVPMLTKAAHHADDNFTEYKNISELSQWNLYSLYWAPISLKDKWLVFEDKDLYDYAKAERIIPATKELEVSFDIVAEQNGHGTFQIEFLDDRGISCSRIEFTPDNLIRVKGGSRFGNMSKYEAGKEINLKAVLSVEKRMLQLFVDGKKVGQRMFYAPVHSIERISFRTGNPRLYPTPETPADWDGVLPNAGEQEPLSVFRIANFKTSEVSSNISSFILDYNDFGHYADRFNTMEDENIIQAISNAQSSEWMKENIPLFECPQRNFEEMYYFRWWSLRKHIKDTPVGYAMTEFLVNRSYADQYNLIACAVGHHIYESRWLHDQKYLDQIIHTWYRGNEGKPMAKFHNFSSWNADALLNRYMVNYDRKYLEDMIPDLESEFAHWDNNHRLENGLYWQGDVQDGMEESISGGRRKKYARPTINSYMYGNAKALTTMALMTGNEKMAMKYGLKTDSIKNMVQKNLWNSKNNFFETCRVDSFANAREAIGYIPWYFNLPDSSSDYETAWKQITDTKGFDAPYGLTTAERRHPEFRTRGVGKCEWDGAIWPFASSQTLTAMANYINNYPQSVVDENIYFDQMERYVESQHHRGRPYIGEYLDEVTGYWLKGDQERARYYNHSTFNDLVITGIAGLRPRLDNTLEINPLVPADKWDWFCLDNILYHGKIVTIIWDKNGDKYNKGKGLRAFVNGKQVGHSETLTRLICENVL